MPKRIPVKSAKAFADALKCTQVIIAAWDGERTHIVTYGKSKEDCAQAALGGNKIKAALGWPKDLNAEPSRIKGLLEKIEELEGRLTSSDAEIIAKIDEALKNPPKVWVVKCTERVRGWNNGDTDYVAFLSETEASDYARSKTSDRTGSVLDYPDYYVAYDMIGQWSITYKMLELMKSTPKQCLYLDNPKDLLK